MALGGEERVMDSRAQFEAWWSENMFIGGKCLADEQTKRRCLRAWQASRAAIDIALPEKISPHNTNESGYVIGQAAMYDEAIDDCAEAIRAIGISIKGESS